jgi:hypothetical protein
MYWLLARCGLAASRELAVSKQHARGTQSVGDVHVDWQLPTAVRQRFRLIAAWV